MRGWAEVVANLGPGSSREYLEAHPARAKGMEGALNQYGASVMIRNTLKVSPTPWELASAAATSHWQLAVGSDSGGDHQLDSDHIALHL